MTELATLIEKRRIALNRLNLDLSNEERVKVENKIAEIDRAINLMRFKASEDDVD